MMPRLGKQKGFGLVEILIGVASILIVFVINSRVVSTQMLSVRKLNQKLAAIMLQQNLGSLLLDQEVIERLFKSHNLSSSLRVNDSPNNKGVQCIIAKRSGAGNIPCISQVMPANLPSKCAGTTNLENRNLCWIRESLGQYKVDVIPHPNPAKNTAADLLIDMRDPDYQGVSPQFTVCNEFSSEKDKGNSVTCPFQVEVYAWVECDAGEPFCGATTTFSGQIKMAAIVIPHGILAASGAFELSNYSVINIDVGTL